MGAGNREPEWTCEMDTRLHQELSELLAGEAQIIKEMSARYVTWYEFLEMPLSEGLTHEAAWSLMKQLSRASGIELPIPDVEGNPRWYHRTHELVDAAAIIGCMCGPESALYRSLTTAQNHSVLVQSRVDETVAAALLEGLQVSAEDAGSLLRLDRTPRSDTERLVRNTLTALDDMETLLEVPFSKELFWHLRYLVMKGVDVRKIKRTKRRMGLLTSDYSDRVVREAADRQLDYIGAYMNNLAGDVHDLAVVRALLIPDVFRYYRPLPDLNSEVGRLAFRLFALKSGLPVLGMLPLSKAKLDWEDGLVDPSVVRLSSDIYLAAFAHDGEDRTGWATLSMQLALAALNDLTSQLRDFERRDEELRALLQQDSEINHRQRSILGRALRNPTSEFCIAYHKNTHQVVYATARADLLELVDKGFLVMGKKGRAMVFTPREGLRDFIENEYRPA